ncbi:hypothetical protein AFM11_23290 [Mycolicibacterium wolinskyi]|uniref:Uncharacterized protein n=1 Tax=Mycolicibacterium wolinskyi TaxID=59750 RepID=A0A132PIF5_9MYCO|nr:hypothetical protein AFM11_23290 [Mycolicibacterium wolinskyi]
MATVARRTGVLYRPSRSQSGSNTAQIIALLEFSNPVNQFQIVLVVVENYCAAASRVKGDAIAGVIDPPRVNLLRTSR